MKSNDLLIVGAGFTGLLAAHAWPNAKLLEAAPNPKNLHHALMRFRTDACAKLTGVEFRKVQVRKGIFFEGQFAPPSPKVCNLYARKVVGRVIDRSIWHTEPVERFIAPENFYEQLVEAVGKRISWGYMYEASQNKTATILNTAPIWLMLNMYKVGEALLKGITRKKISIRVRRWRVPGADIFQTIYFPDPETSIYRASITGDLLVVEEICDNLELDPLAWVEEAFGLDAEALEPLDDAVQSQGKVDELPELTRKQLLFELTAKHNIYSLGRFATWRNVLLDDVINDIAVVKRLLKTRTAYDARKATL